jgi:hypothetical protein
MRTMQQAAAARPLGVSSTLRRNHTSLILQREAGAHASGAAQPDLVHGVLNSPGRPLDSSTRDFMEPKLGHDLSGVRVHSDDAAARAAQSVRANAFTAGNHVVFGSGRYTPGTPSGRHLLAHELTHVTQQARGPVSATPIGGGLSVSDPHDSFEREARANADRMDAPAPLRETQNLIRIPAEQQGDANIQRDAAGVIGAVAGVVGGVAALAALGFAIAAWRRPANPAPTTGAILVNQPSNPIQALPDASPPSARAQTGLADPHTSHAKVLDLKTDDDNVGDINAEVMSDGVSVFSVMPQSDPGTGYRGGTGGSSAVLNCGTPIVVAKPVYSDQQPTPTPAPAAAPAAAPAPAPAPARRSGHHDSQPTLRTPPRQPPAPQPRDTVGVVRVPFTGTNTKDEGSPIQQFAGNFTVKGDGQLSCDDCHPTNHVGYAQANAHIGHVDYQGHVGPAATSTPAPATTPTATPAAPATPPATGTPR